MTNYKKETCIRMTLDEDDCELDLLRVPNHHQDLMLGDSKMVFNQAHEYANIR